LASVFAAPTNKAASPSNRSRSNGQIIAYSLGADGYGASRGRATIIA